MLEIMKFKMVNAGAKVASFDVKLHKWHGYVIRECSLFESGDKKWITLTSRQYEVDGKKKYFELGGFEDRALNDKLKLNIMNAVQEYMEKMVSSNHVQHAEQEQVPF